MTVTSRLHRQKDKERQRKTEENVDRRPVVAPRYESGGEAQALVRPARDRGLPLPKTCAARVVACLGERRVGFLGEGGFCHFCLQKFFQSHSCALPLQRDPKLNAQNNGAQLDHREDIFSQLPPILRSAW